MLELETLEQLQSLVTQKAQETLTLEFKSSAALGKSSAQRGELAKDVSSLANSAGGQIVYGVSERNSNADVIDKGVDPTSISTEWLGQTLATMVSPRIQGLRIKAINLTDSVSVAYVITVPQANALAPHQNTFDMKYYKRFDCRAVPMADYEIRDALARGRAPHVIMRMSFAEGSQSIRHPDRRIPFELILSAENISVEPSLYTLLEFQIDANLIFQSNGNWKIIDDKKLGYYDMRRVQKTLMVPETFPLMRNSNVTFGPPDIRLCLPHNPCLINGMEGYLISFITLGSGFRLHAFTILRYDCENLFFGDFDEFAES